MPDGTLPQLCDGSDGHHPPSAGQPHCPACLVAASPGLLAPPLVVVGTTAAPGVRLGLPAVDPPAAAPPWRPRLARATGLRLRLTNDTRPRGGPSVRAGARKRRILRCLESLPIALALALAATAAKAHITLEAADAPVGSTYKAVLRVPHGCEGEATLKVRVQHPRGRDRGQADAQARLAARDRHRPLRAAP